MPFTPFHMGPAATFKLLGINFFSFTLFGYSQILMDLEPLFRLLRGDDMIHGHSHTYIGAIIIGAFAIGTGKPLCEYCLAIWNEVFKLKFLQVPETISWKVAAFSAFLGTISHVFLDSIMHFDMKPWIPYTDTNKLLHVVSVEQLHLWCLAFGGLGAIGLLVIWISKFSKLKNK